MDKDKKKCVICQRHNKRKGGKHLRYIYDEEFNDYHCNECEELVHDAVRNYSSSTKYDPLLDLYRGPSWLAQTEEFEKTLDLGWTIDDILDIIKEEII